MSSMSSLSSLRLLRFASLALVLGGCARSVPVTSDGASGAVALSSVSRWSADLKQPTMNASPVIATGGTGGAQASSYGTVTLTQLPGGERVRYELTVTSPPAAGQALAWALFTGSCVTPSPPVVPVNELPPIDLGSGGGGLTRGEFVATLDPKATYNVRVYTKNRATDVNNVLLCARLNYSGRR